MELLCKNRYCLGQCSDLVSVCCGLLLMAKRFAMKMIRGQFVEGTNNIIDLDWCDNGSVEETQKNDR